MKIIYASIFTLIFLLNLTKTYSQEIIETQITDNFDELFINKDSPFSSISDKTVNLYFNDAKNLYYFQIEYNGKSIYREGIKKSSPINRASSPFRDKDRFKYKIYLDASLISDSDKLILLESYTNKIIDISGKKIIVLGNYEIIKADYYKNKYSINNLLENMKVNIYKVEFK